MKDINNKFENLIVKIILLFIFLIFINIFIGMNITYASSKSKEEIGNYIAEFAINFAKKHSSETVYSWNASHRSKAYCGQKTSGTTEGGKGSGTRFSNKYALDCVGWVSMAIHQSTGLDCSAALSGSGGFVTPQSLCARSEGYFEIVSGSPKPGDILIAPSTPHVMIYVGNNEIVHTWGNAGGGTVNKTSKSVTPYTKIARITNKGVKAIKDSKLTTVFKGQGSVSGLTGKASAKETAQGKIANFARSYVNEGNKKDLLRYSQDNRMKGYNNRLSSHSGADSVNASFTNKLAFDCSSFVAFVYKKTCDIELLDNGWAWTTSSYKSNAASKNKIFKVVKYGSVTLQPGDILWKDGHVALYIGNNQIAEASSPENGVRIHDIYSFTEVYRLSKIPSAETVQKNSEKFKWPDGSKLVIQDTDIDDMEFEGLQEGNFDMVEFNFDWVLNSLAELLDWFIGITTYIFRMVFIGWASIIELTINAVMEWTTGEEASLTIEKLVNNKVPMLDVNFFNFKTAGGMDLAQDSVMYTIRENIAAWYYIVRNISIIGLLITLIYLGVRMALATVGEQKAKYKELLVSWLVSFIIVFAIHYVMIFILNLNSSLIDLINASLGRRRRIII